MRKLFKIFLSLAFPYFCYPAADMRKLEDRIARHPYDSQALYNLGVLAFKAGDFKKAESCFSVLKTFCADKKIDQDKAIQVYYNAGNTEFQLKDYQAALASFEAVLGYDSSHQKAREKRDYIKQLLEQKKKQENNNQENQNKQDRQMQDQQDDKQDQQKQDQQDKRDQEQKQNQQKQQGQEDKQASEQAEQGKKKDQLPESQKELLTLAEKLDNQAQEQLVRQQLCRRVRSGGQHEW